MLEPLRHVLAAKRIVLCSGSPRRKELLNQIGLKFEIIPSNFEENLDKASFAHPSSYVKENAKRKALDVWRSLSVDKDSQPDLIIGADTVVSMDDKIYGKPQDEEDAIDMLSALSGKKHTVFTGNHLAATCHSNSLSILVLFTKPFALSSRSRPGVALLTKSQATNSESNGMHLMRETLIESSSSRRFMPEPI